MSDGSLTVTSVSREDRGAYTCRAYSIQGEAVHTTHLLVQGREIFSVSLSLDLCRSLPGLLNRGERFLRAQPAQLGVREELGGWGLSHMYLLP